jgi:hypothetical protein
MDNEERLIDPSSNILFSLTKAYRSVGKPFLGYGIHVVGYLVEGLVDAYSNIVFSLRGCKRDFQFSIDHSSKILFL